MPPHQKKHKQQKQKSILQQMEKLPNSRWDNQQNEKTAYRQEKIFANHMSDKELISKIYTPTTQLKKKKKKRSDYKWVENMSRHFSEEGIQMAKGA